MAVTPAPFKSAIAELLNADRKEREGERDLETDGERMAELLSDWRKRGRET